MGSRCQAMAHSGPGVRFQGRSTLTGNGVRVVQQDRADDSERGCQAEEVLASPRWDVPWQLPVAGWIAVLAHATLFSGVCQHCPPAAGTPQDLSVPPSRRQPERGRRVAATGGSPVPAATNGIDL